MFESPCSPTVVRSLESDTRVRRMGAGIRTLWGLRTPIEVVAKTKEDGKGWRQLSTAEKNSIARKKDKRSQRVAAVAEAEEDEAIANDANKCMKWAAKCRACVNSPWLNNSQCPMCTEQNPATAAAAAAAVADEVAMTRSATGLPVSRMHTAKYDAEERDGSPKDSEEDDNGQSVSPLCQSKAAREETRKAREQRRAERQYSIVFLPNFERLKKWRIRFDWPNPDKLELPEPLMEDTEHPSAWEDWLLFKELASGRDIVRAMVERQEAGTDLHLREEEPAKETVDSEAVRLKKKSYPTLWKDGKEQTDQWKKEGADELRKASLQMERERASRKEGHERQRLGAATRRTATGFAGEVKGVGLQ